MVPCSYCSGNFASSAMWRRGCRARLEELRIERERAMAMTNSKLRLAAILLAGLAALPVAAQQGPIKVGEINSYSGMAAFTGPYKNGLLLAEEEVNAAGGVLGRKLEIVTRDDGLKPEDAVRAASELLTSEKVAL